MQSLQWCIAHRDWTRLTFTLAPGLVWLALLPVLVSVGSVLMGGFLVAIIVTLTHESEEIITEREVSYVRMQFRGTRDAVCPDTITVSTSDIMLCPYKPS